MKSIFFVSNLFLLICFLSVDLYSQATPDAIMGIWFNEEKDAKIKVYKEEGKFYGKIVWHKTGDDVSPYDQHNPDPELRTRKKVGLVILNEFDFKGGQWENGTIYDPKSGKTYSCVIKMQKDGSLNVRGYIGISLIGRTTNWTKAE
jgi:uncharacterized protein (DUF2147 family)